jgi:hypothetical protein
LYRPVASVETVPTGVTTVWADPLTPVPAVRGGISVPFEMQPMVKSAPKSSNLLFISSPECPEIRTVRRRQDERGKKQHELTSELPHDIVLKFQPRMSDPNS